MVVFGKITFTQKILRNVLLMFAWHFTAHKACMLTGLLEISELEDTQASSSQGATSVTWRVLVPPRSPGSVQTKGLRTPQVHG